MKLFYSLIIVLTFSGTVLSQNEIGETTIVFNDPSRTGGVGDSGNPGRQIETAIYYPAENAGEDVDVLEGEHPLVIIAHGFAMGYSAYENLWEHLVNVGYIVALPKTESSAIPAPSHEDFGLDIVNVREGIESLNSEINSIFYQKHNGRTAYIGHSMGGGASVLATEVNSPDLYVGLAPAETDPSAIQAASNVSCPAIIFSGTGDAVTPPEDHQIPIYEALTSNCKMHISIIGGAHCYYANQNAACDAGELLSGGDITLDREEQQDLVFGVLSEALKEFLEEVDNSASLEDVIDNENFELTNDCQSLNLAENQLEHVDIFPNPFENKFILRVTENNFEENITFTIFDSAGKLIEQNEMQGSTQSINTNNWNPGIYFIKFNGAINNSMKVVKK